MMFTKSVAAALLAYVSFASATPALFERQNGVTCQTTMRSPLNHGAVGVIHELHAKGGKCAQTNPTGSRCSNLASHGTASVQICGLVEDVDSALTCDAVAQRVRQIRETCVNDASPRRVGGTFTVSPNKRIVLFNAIEARD